MSGNEQNRYWDKHMKHSHIKNIFFAFMLLSLGLFTYIFCVKLLPINKPIFEHRTSIETNSPLEREKIALIFSNTDFSQYVKTNTNENKEAIDNLEAHKSGRVVFIRPEDRGEDFSAFSTGAILNKLKNGDKVEQRKAANALWVKFGASVEKLTEGEKNEISDSTRKYLSQINSDFEENFMQVQRLWHLAVPVLLEHVTNSDVSVSENSARLLSLMKTPQIIDHLIAKSDGAKSATELKKYIFALQYMKINNRYFLENRKRMSDIECENYYNNKVVPQIKKLTQELEKSK